MCVGLVATPVFTELAVMLPSTARLLFQFIPPPVIFIEPAPETAPLNSLKVSPTASVGPRFCTVTVPVPLPDKLPLTDTMSLDWPGERDLLTRTKTLPLSVRSLLMVNVPIEVAEPPPMALLVAMMTGPARVPEPASGAAAVGDDARKRGGGSVCDVERAAGASPIHAGKVESTGEGDVVRAADDERVAGGGRGPFELVGHGARAANGQQSSAARAAAGFRRNIDGAGSEGRIISNADGAGGDGRAAGVGVGGVQNRRAAGALNDAARAGNGAIVGLDVGRALIRREGKAIILRQNSRGAVRIDGDVRVTHGIGAVSANAVDVAFDLRIQGQRFARLAGNIAQKHAGKRADAVKLHREVIV